jgi:selenide,water dikinase
MAEKVHEAGAIIAGGHTIQDKEPKAGLAIIGMAHPERLLTKTGAQPGDVLILTKPLGTGTIVTAGKQDKAKPEHITEAIQWMTNLNHGASVAALRAQAHAMTDITGFGLLGHASEMIGSNHIAFELFFGDIPLLAGVENYASEGIFPGGSVANQQAFRAKVHFEAEISLEKQMILFDAQTSGGLLIALSSEQIDAFSAEMLISNLLWWKIGRVVSRRVPACIVVTD